MLFFYNLFSLSAPSSFPRSHLDSPSLSLPESALPPLLLHFAFANRAVPRPACSSTTYFYHHISTRIPQSPTNLYPPTTPPFYPLSSICLCVLRIADSSWPLMKFAGTLATPPRFTCLLSHSLSICLFAWIYTQPHPSFLLTQKCCCTRTFYMARAMVPVPHLLPSIVSSYFLFSAFRTCGSRVRALSVACICIYFCTTAHISLSPFRLFYMS